MANFDRPRGFVPKGEVKQSVPMTCGADVVHGEFVKLSADGKIDAAGSDEDIIGLALDSGSDGEEISVSVDPSQIYIGQADEDDIDAQTDIGNVCDILATAENSTYSQARQEVDSDTIGQGSAKQLVIMGVARNANNALGAQVDVEVKINEHQIMGENDSVGV